MPKHQAKTQQPLLRSRSVRLAPGFNATLDDQGRVIAVTQYGFSKIDNPSHNKGLPPQ